MEEFLTSIHVTMYTCTMYHIVYFKYLTIVFVNYNSVKLERKKRDQHTGKKRITYSF